MNLTMNITVSTAWDDDAASQSEAGHPHCPSRWSPGLQDDVASPD